MRRLLLALLLLLAPSLASAQVTNNRMRLRTLDGSNYLLNNVAANASAGARTVTVAVGGYKTISWTFGLTRVAGTAINMTCKGSTDQGVTYGDIPSMAISGGTGTLTPFTWTQTTSVSGAIIIDMSTGNYDSLQCIFSVTTGGGSDLIKVSAIAGQS